jgi:hypothetical protein
MVYLKSNFIIKKKNLFLILFKFKNYFIFPKKKKEILEIMRLNTSDERILNNIYEDICQ